MGAIRAWFAERGWRTFDFQRAAWRAYLGGKSGLIHAPSGRGKTLAAWMGPVIEALGGTEEADADRSATVSRSPLRVLWITPLRALATDTHQSLAGPLASLAPGLDVAIRTGDTPSSQRARLREHLPFALITTPESLSLMLSYPDAREKFSALRCVVVDEWHELLGTKRGVQTELGLARLRSFRPNLRTWGLSATIGNLDEALRVLAGSAHADAEIIHSSAPKRVDIKTLLPRSIDSFPWSGHLGTRMVNAVVERIEAARTTLLFTNVRSQTEIWFQELLAARPGWEPVLAMHHGSLERDIRRDVERRLREGTVKCVVCTSSLDLGVDFSPVDQVIQVGSPKGIARIIQRAGRSGHRPGATSTVIGVPTNAFELVEFAAAREAIRERRIEARRPLLQPLDVLLQHLVTVAIGGGFRPDELYDEVRRTHAYADLAAREWNWLLTFISTGGSLRAYPEYRKVSIDESGLWSVTDPRLARVHRLTIGTIVSDTAVSLRMTTGRRLGSVEEGFITRLKPGQMFVFGGRRLELVRHHGLVATVRPARRSGARGQIPTWQGGKSPLSTELAAAVGRKLLAFDRDPAAVMVADRELRCAGPVLALQREWSIIPSPDQFLIELFDSRDGYHAFAYPFAGRLVNEGLGLLVSYRLSRNAAVSIQVTPNDYGFELYAAAPFDLSPDEWRALFTPEGLLADLLACLNTAELGRHQFREIARVAGLVIQGFPGNLKPARALQASSGLLYDVFARYDPDNLLLEQAQRQVLERQLEIARLRESLNGLESREWVVHRCHHLSPMAFPLWADSISSHFSNEDFAQRLERMIAELEAAAAHAAAFSPAG